MDKIWQHITTNYSAQMAVDLTTAKAHLRVDDDDEDELITTLIQAATTRIQEHCQAALIESTWYNSLHTVSNKHRIPLGNAVSITNVKYYDSNNIEKTLDNSNYKFAAGGFESTIIFTNTFPSTYKRSDAITIELIAGFSSTSLIPPALVSAVLLLIGHLFENRQAAEVGKQYELPLGVNFLCAPYTTPAYF